MDKETLQKPKNRKVLVGIIAAAVLLLGLVFGSITIAGNSPARRADKYLDLGDKYLSELNYEQALVAYRQVLEIEPKNLDAYRGGLAAYVGLGDRDGMAEFYTDALGMIESMTEQELRPVHDTAVEIYLYADAVYPEDHEAAALALERGFDTLGGDERIVRGLIAEYGILAGMYIDAGDYEKEEAIYQKILEKGLENAEALSGWEQRVRERFKEYLSRNGGSGNAPEATDGEYSLHFAESDGLLRPVNGATLIPYSMDNSVYFATLRDYRYNPALILAAEAGTPVTACAEGKVVDISQNAEIGHTVTMELGDGYKLTYGQLEGITVELNSYVQEGDIIGSVAAPTKYFRLEGSNLYLEMTKNGDPMNPEPLFRE